MIKNFLSLDHFYAYFWNLQMDEGIPWDILVPHIAGFYKQWPKILKLIMEQIVSQYSDFIELEIRPRHGSLQTVLHKIFCKLCRRRKSFPVQFASSELQ